jgi:hypothetical protein
LVVGDEVEEDFVVAIVGLLELLLLLLLLIVVVVVVTIRVDDGVVQVCMVETGVMLFRLKVDRGRRNAMDDDAEKATVVNVVVAMIF